MYSRHCQITARLSRRVVRQQHRDFVFALNRRNRINPKVQHWLSSLTNTVQIYRMRPHTHTHTHIHFLHWMFSHTQIYKGFLAGGRVCPVAELIHLIHVWLSGVTRLSHSVLTSCPQEMECFLSFSSSLIFVFSAYFSVFRLYDFLLTFLPSSLCLSLSQFSSSFSSTWGKWAYWYLP